jgi:hypothetical protein
MIVNYKKIAQLDKLADLYTNLGPDTVAIKPIGLDTARLIILALKEEEREYLSINKFCSRIYLYFTTEDRYLKLSFDNDTSGTCYKISQKNKEDQNFNGFQEAVEIIKKFFKE